MPRYKHIDLLWLKKHWKHCSKDCDIPTAALCPSQDATVVLLCAFYTHLLASDQQTVKMSVLLDKFINYSIIKYIWLAVSG